LRSVAKPATAARPAREKASGLPTFKQYRERDGLFYFKLTDAQGQVLLQSRGFEQPRAAGPVIAALTQGGAAALAQQAAYLQDDTPALRQAAASALDQLAEAARAS